MFGRDKEKADVIETLPMVPLRDVVVFPHMMIPFVIGRASSIKALEYALVKGKRIFLSAQHDATRDNPGPDEIHTLGTICNIVQSLKLPDGNVKVLVEGLDRGRALEFKEHEGFFKVVCKLIPRQTESVSGVEALMSKVIALFEQYVKLSNNLHYDAMLAAVRVEDPGKLADTIASHLVVGVEEKQNLLEIFAPQERLTRIHTILEAEVEKLQVDKRIQGRVKKQMERAQKEYYLNEKMKAIQKELGRKDDRLNEVDELRKKIEMAKMPKEAEDRALQELKRLEAMPPMSAEATVSRNYLDWLIAVPWSKRTRERKDLLAAEKILNEDHYGLEKVKERIVEFLAVRQLVNKPKGPILCLVGPPGVGKTSLARSIARCTNRKFVRMSLGGVRDEAEIRGHRRTYIGAFPGQIIQMMKKAGTVNPVFLLDEVDKLSSDFRGDPASALLEVLDPEQNHTFVDHYLDVEYDLSKVMFIATANIADPIPPALKDRMELIPLSGYTPNEKIAIARQFLVPKQREANGLKPGQIEFSDDAILALITSYTREAGVRNLEREIGGVCRKVARKIVQKKAEVPIPITPENLKDFLGKPRFRNRRKGESSEVGVATGLAWTEAGGEILAIETSLLKGKGNLMLTGSLGDVMQESARAGVSYVRSRAELYDADPNFHEKYDIHIHVPEGAIPKDGPSAGITMAVSLFSAVTKIPVLKDVAMTGEITLRGKVLPVGGIKDKVLAAYRAGILTIILSAENEKDLDDLPEEVRSKMEFHLVSNMDEVIKIAMEGVPPTAATLESETRPAEGGA